jgi:hypothetical protein
MNNKNIYSNDQDMYVNDRTFFLDKETKTNSFLYEDNEDNDSITKLRYTPELGFNSNMNTIVDSIGIKNILKQDKKKEKKVKKEKSYFNEFVTIAFIFYILNSQSMIKWMFKNKIEDYNTSLLMRCGAFMVIYYILKFFIFI